MLRHARSLATIACLLLAVPALGQDPQASPPPPDDDTLEEITVTATRRGETDVRTTPVAVTALTAERVDALAARDLGDIARLVPNFSNGKPAGFNAASFAMRGVGQTSIIVYADPQVGVTVDDFVIPHIQTQVLEMFDIEQVEVLRGPQGTLFGKNTTGGVVNVRTKRPQLDAWSAEIRGLVANYGRHEERFAVNVPLIKDQLAVRGAGIFINSDGFYENDAVFGPVTAFDPTHPADGTTGRGDGDDLGGDDVFSGRLKALWQPVDELRAMFTYEIIRDDSDSPPVYNGTPNDPRLVFANLGLTGEPGDPIDRAGITERDDLLLDMSKGHRVDVDGYYLNIEWDIGDFTVYGVGGYREQESRLPSTYTGEVGPNSLFDATRDDDRETWQGEVRVASRFGGAFDFVAGAFYQEDETDFCVLQVLGFLDLIGLGTAFFGDPTFFDNNPQVLCNAQEAEAWALFVDGTYRVNERFELGAGFRWTDEKKEWTGRNQVFIQALGGGFDPTFTWRELGDPLAAGNFGRFPAGVVRDSKSWEEPTWRLTASYDLTESIFGYFTYARGFKSGAYNDQTGTSGSPITPASAAPTDPEIADSFELGFKFDLFDGRTRLDLIGFYTIYDDAQRDLVAQFTNQFGGTFQETRFFNAAEVTAFGIEGELKALLTDDLMLRANIGWLDTEYDKFEADTDFDGMTDIDLSDRDVNRAPEYQASVDLLYTRGFWNGEVEALFNANYEDESIFVYSNVDPALDGTTSSRTLFNLSLTYTDQEDRFFVRAFGKNLGDKRYRIGELPVADLWIMSYYGEPRTYGLEVGVKFGGD